MSAGQKGLLVPEVLSEIDERREDQLHVFAQLVELCVVDWLDVLRLEDCD